MSAICCGFPVASVNSLGIESLFSREIYQSPTGTNEFIKKDQPFELLQNVPNPFDEVTILGVKMNIKTNYQKAVIIVRDIQGRLVKEIPIELDNEINEVPFEHGYGTVGIYSYSLIVDGTLIGTKQMVYAN